uniref:3beta-hydroxysteroid-dehydrogenase/decarboxylase isoform 2-like n=1 Tax=Fragaria vesca subsp. vesca TaxID=101020 RepID=UPI0005C8A517|nr:PREDICTED: 3beta-hydroxysteroid-dehydrogenase/decarboxylase isoform 2-like [Fragaria vesca subsp. vesca]
MQSICFVALTVADTLLWKDKKQTFKALLVLITIYYNFIASQATVITVISKSLMFASIFVFISSNLPEKILGYKLEKLQSSHFHLSEEMSQQISGSVASSWNISMKTLKSLGKGNDWTLFLKVALSLLVLSFLGAISLQTSFIIGVSTAFLAFYVYEKQEEKIDAMVLEAFSHAKIGNRVLAVGLKSKARLHIGELAEVPVMDTSHLTYKSKVGRLIGCKNKKSR